MITTNGKKVIHNAVPPVIWDVMRRRFGQYFCSALLGLRTTRPQLVVSRLALGTIHLHHPHNRGTPFHVFSPQPPPPPTSSTSRSFNGIRYNLFETMKLQLDWNSWVFDLATSLEHCLSNGRDMITVPPFTLCQCILAAPMYTAMPLKCHWSTQCALGHHWATQRMLQGTLEHHWKNVVETALHWNNTEETLLQPTLEHHWIFTDSG